MNPPKQSPQLCPLIVATTFATLLAGTASAGIMSYTPMSGDADSGINPLLNYTAKADFNGIGHTVNGVTFSDTGFVGTGYTLTGPDGFIVGGAEPNNVTGEVGGMVNDFVFGGGGNATLTLSGLTFGTEYVTTWYNRAWGGLNGRVVFITASDISSAPFRIDQNFTGTGNGSVIRYTFTATGTTQTYAFDAASDGDSFHHYAVSNAVRNDAILPFTGAPVAPRVSFQNGGGSQTPGVLSNDLLQTQLAGVSSTGTFNSEGSGGIGILYNGSFTASSDLTAFVTPNPGATVTFSLDVSTNILGYDISSVRGYGGWQDSGRDQQHYNLFYSLVGDTGFAFLGTVNYDVPNTPNPSAISSVFDTALTGVDAIRVDFLGPVENGYTGYGEFDVLGSATVPEPGTAASLLGGLGLLLGARRRRA